MKPRIKVGDTIKIIKVASETNMFPEGIDKQAEAYNGRTGTVGFIDSSGALHGTWGGLAVLPEIDEIEIME